MVNSQCKAFEKVGSAQDESYTGVYKKTMDRELDVCETNGQISQTGFYTTLSDSHHLCLW